MLFCRWKVSADVKMTTAFVTQKGRLLRFQPIRPILPTSDRQSALKSYWNSSCRHLDTNTEPPLPDRRTGECICASTEYDWREQTFIVSVWVWLRGCAGVFVRACQAASGLFPGPPRKRCFAVGSPVSSLLIFSSDAEGTRGAQTPLCVSEVASDGHLEKLFEENLWPLEPARSQGFLGRGSEENLAAPYVCFLL